MSVNEKMTAIANNIRRAVDGTIYKNLANPSEPSWKTNTRINSSLVETTGSAAGQIVTNYIPVKKGDTVRINGMTIDNNFKLVYYLDAADTKAVYAVQLYYYPAAYTTDENGTLVYKLFTHNIEENGQFDYANGDMVTHFRVSGTPKGNVNDIIITVNEELTIFNDEEVPQEKLLNLDSMAEKIYEVHTLGKDRGKQEQYDAFWYNFQQNGKRRDYNYGFVGHGFNADNFYPKYKIVLEGNNTYTFGYWSYGVSGKTTLNLRERLEQCEVVLDTSKATGLTAMFSYSDFTEIPTIDCSSLTTATTNLFNGNGNLTKIEKIKTHENVTYKNWFRYDTLLADVTFEGEIGQDIDFSPCPNLSRASIENIVEHLSDTSTGKTLTLSKYAVNRAFTTAEFEALKATRTNWTISLV